MRVQPSCRAGFTLTEIMVVVAIIGLLVPIAIPNFIRARASAQMNTCINNLRQLDSAKQEWAMETVQPPTATPDTSDIQPYVGRGGSLVNLFCPQDPARTTETSYDLKDVASMPVCLLDPATHVLK